MAQNFNEWLETGILNYRDCLNDKITVVGLIGKDTTQLRISTIANRKLFHRVVFKEQNNSKLSTSASTFLDIVITKISSKKNERLSIISLFCFSRKFSRSSLP